MTAYIPSPQEVMEKRSPRGSWTRAQLAEWGVSWPPPGGWKKELASAWEESQRAFAEAGQTTLDDRRPAAVICRERGWGAGTCLVGDEGDGPAVIRITAIGEEIMLARQISQNGRPYHGSEHSWCLDCRDWKAVKP